MALSATQRAQVRFYLGYSDISQGGDPNALERAMTSLTASAETIVAAILVKLVALDTDLDSVTSANRAGVIEVDNGGVKWNPNGAGASGEVANQGRRLVARLASMFGVSVLNDIYGAGTGLGFGFVGMG